MDTYARFPVEFVRGAGTRLWDDEGNEYLDFLCGISVSLLGHCHPAVVEAICDQAGRLIHVGNLFHTEPPRRLAERLAELSIGGKVFFTNSGAEAIECALKLARKRRRGGDFVVLQRGFHGRTYGALSATPQEAKQAPFAPLVPGFTAVPPHDPEALRAAVTDDTAAVIVEAVQGEGGIHPLESGLLEAARAACDEHGALLICDEVQAGIGRTGTFFASEQLGVKPDAVTLAKGLANGLPIGCLLVTSEAAGAFQPGDHASTFGGNPVVCAAGVAVCDTLTPELLASVTEAEAAVCARFPEIRGRGLLLGLDIDRPAADVVTACLDRGVVIGTAGERTLRLTPPLTISPSELEHGVDVLTEVLG
jgi:acetylornithine/N-succinyldiaminopimelate aminotransferase